MCLNDTSNTWRQVGIVSRGLVCNTTEVPNVIARIQKHIPFIESFTQEGK